MMASPPKPWERAGAAATAATPPAGTLPSRADTAASPAASGAAPPPPVPPPPVPDRPASLSAAAAYSSRLGGVGGGYAPAAYAPAAYSSPYARFGGLGGMGGYGGYGGGMYGGYGGYGGGAMYGGAMYGGGGMPGGPNDPNSLTSRFNNSTAATFQMLEGVVSAFGGFAQMLESTYMATHSSFFAMVSVAEQFGNLRDTLGSLLGIFTLLRWMRTLAAKLSGRPPPADATALTPAAFARFEGRAPARPDAPPRASRKPLLFFLVAAFGLPYLMSKMIRTLAASHEHEEEERRLQQQQQPVDPARLDFCRLLFDFVPPAAGAGLELQARKGDLVAVLAKNDPAGNPSEWWQCRSRDGRQGYLPSTYLEVLKRPGQEVKKIQPAPASRSSGTSPVAAAVEPLEGMQRSHFYS